MLNNEIWKEIDNLPYEISNLGNVRRSSKFPFKHKKKTTVQPYVNRTGYLCVNLYKNSKCYKFLVHRLIAIYFISNPQNLPEVNHIDGDKQNNSISNLEWVTHQENMKHAWSTGLRKIRYVNMSSKRVNSTSKYKGVSWSEERKKWCAYVTFKKKHYGIGRYPTEVEAAKAYDEFLIKMDMIKHGYSTNFI